VKNKPRIIAFVGPDGCGKSTLARIAAEEMTKHGFQAQIVWSRFNNYFSKPLLGLARLTGHNRREVHDGAEFGYHDFQSSGWLRYPFIFLQTIDVNIATFIKIKRPEKKTDILVFERSPWDTLADIIVDTGCINLATNYWGRLITAQIRGCDRVFYINRSKELILRMRPELKYDKTLDRKIAIYSKLATTGGWLTLDNNRPLEIVKQELIKNCKVIKVD
jgi:ABC-type dipeptide/oligopeptide/nickel transport system ATPase component